VSISSQHDAIIVGAGPNGLAAAITLAQAGCRVLVLEAKATVGGGLRTGELTLPGFHHDICSAIHPLGLGSPFFRNLPLADFGLSWIQPTIPVAHPLDDGTAVALHRSFDTTADSIGYDGRAWRWLFEPLVANWEKLAPLLLGPLPMPRHPLALAQLGIRALWPATGLAGWLFREERAKALFAGLAAHAILPLEQPITAAFGLILGTLGHTVGWPLPRGGSQRIADALAGYFQSLGGEIVVNQPVQRLAELPSAQAILLDVTPRQVLRLAGCPSAIGVNWKSTAMALASSMSITRWLGRLGGGQQSVVRPAQCIWAGPLLKSPPVNEHCASSNQPNGLMCLLPNRVCSMIHALPLVSIRFGPTAMSPTGPLSI
jgi:phytoene dehydrogenase-like protein